MEGGVLSARRTAPSSYSRKSNFKAERTSARNTGEHRSGQLHFQIRSSRPRHFLLSFLTDCHRTGL